MAILISGGIIVNEGSQQKNSIIIEGECIKDVIPDGKPVDCSSFEHVINAEGCIVLPGIIDTHVHFREPGMTHKADMQSESRAAAYGGVTSVFDMPNTIPQTTNAEALQQKMELARNRMYVNYTFFPGATNSNVDELKRLCKQDIPGIKLFMGSSTGNMLVDQEQALNAIFEAAYEMNIPIMAHCEDTASINRNMQHYKDKGNTDDPDVTFHPLIRSSEACYKSTSLAVKLARRHGTRLHIAHVSTARELSLLTPSDNNITMEATVAHLMFSEEDYVSLGSLIKCNPAIKTVVDKQALRKALIDGKIYTVATDHAPHTLQEKQGGAAKAMSGMPMVQFSLSAMLSLVDEGVLCIERLVELMCHNPASLFSVEGRGFLRKGYKADITIVKKGNTPWEITTDCIQSKCGWSPLIGCKFAWQVQQTICNGNIVYDRYHIQKIPQGHPLRFVH